MILLNFSHPITLAQQAQIETLAGAPVVRTIEIPTQFDEQRAFAPQLAEALAGVLLTAAEWQTEPLIVALPSLNFIAALLLAELHGRMGYFPTVVRMRPLEGNAPRRYEVAELLELQAVRDAARRLR